MIQYIVQNTFKTNENISWKKSPKVFYFYANIKPKIHLMESNQV